MSVCPEAATRAGRYAHVAYCRRDAARRATKQSQEPFLSPALAICLSCESAESAAAPAPLPDSPAPFARSVHPRNSALSETSNEAIRQERAHGVSCVPDQYVQSSRFQEAQPAPRRCERPTNAMSLHAPAPEAAHAQEDPAMPLSRSLTLKSRRRFYPTQGRPPHGSSLRRQRSQGIQQPSCAA